MCGILGQVNSDQPISEGQFNGMRDTLKHRGPDGFGSTFFQQGRVALGHRRLSIIDLSDKGNQPMANEGADIWVTFNGEIYNFQALKKELERLGHRFQSNSDTEVLVHGYEEWGRGLLGRLKGMFAFGIWDDKKQELFLARDRFGIKPLYYYPGKDRFIFASELKGILADPNVPRHLNQEAVTDFFLYRSVPSPKSIWEGIFKLPPGHFLHLKKDGNYQVQTYWEVSIAEHEITLPDAVEKVQSLLAQSVREQSLADVPVGLFLSGGFDSSTIAWLLARQGEKVDSFTMGFENWALSEHESARLASKSFGTIHHEYFTGSSAFSNMSELSYYFDEPLGGTSLLPTFELARETAKKAKVVLAGDGGDELFAGYKWHQSFFEPWYIHPRRSFRHFVSGQNTLTHHYQRAMNWTGWNCQDLSYLLGPAMSKPDAGNDIFAKLKPLGPNNIKSLQLLDYQYFLPEVVLHKIDRASMANSLEVRVPFLDHEITEFMMQLSSQVYFKKGQNKHLLYQMVSDHFPAPLLHKPKKGFGMSVNHFFSEKYFPENWQTFQVFSQQIINATYVSKLIQEKEYKKLWAVFIFMTWYERWN